MPYYCPGGILTCGWGSTGVGVYPNKRWTQDYADNRMRTDALRFARATHLLCPKIATTGALCAIADFAYNLGLGTLKNSTLRRKINEDNWEGAIRELRKWVHSGGRVLHGLVARREAEIELLMKL